MYINEIIGQWHWRAFMLRSQKDSHPKTNEETRREKALGQNRGETSQKIRPHKWLTSDDLSKHSWDVYHPFFWEHHRWAHRSDNCKNSVYAIFSGGKKVQSRTAVRFLNDGSKCFPVNYNATVNEYLCTGVPKNSRNVDRNNASIQRRFWQTRFTKLKPVRSTANRTMYACQARLRA